jgi:hypothetical protein
MSMQYQVIMHNFQKSKRQLKNRLSNKTQNKEPLLIKVPFTNLLMCDCIKWLSFDF